jgi:DNA-directed RNA polymerase subunit RPC12/RpoP
VSRHYLIVCPRCGSFKLRRAVAVAVWEKLCEWWIDPTGRGQAGTYACEACGEPFTVRNAAAHARHHPPDVLGRCRACDRRGGLELVRRNHRSHAFPTEEVADLYRCPDCGAEVVMIVKEDPAKFYD